MIDERAADESDPEEETALSLSGGGFRAAIFHLGALWRLNEIGALPRITKISCVSGGSILGAFIGHTLNPWPTSPLDGVEWRTRVVDPFRSATRQDMRTLPVAARFLPWNYVFRPWIAVEKLADQYRRKLFGGRRLPLDSMPTSPEIIFCATDMVFGINWESSRRRVGNYQVGYCEDLSLAPDWTIDRAVAASSCFPPIFAPMRSGLSPEVFTRRGEYRQPDRDEKIMALRLTDGGLYDNLGVQPVINSRNILASDGGGRLDLNWQFGNVRHVLRYTSLLQENIARRRRAELAQVLKRRGRSSALWSIADRGTEEQPGYPHEVRKHISQIRTDLNPFTDAEFEILINHGYFCCDARIGGLGWVAGETPAACAPYPARLDAEATLRSLRRSDRRFTPRWMR